MILLDQMIASGRLEEFVYELVKTYNEEKEDETLWEIWLHRVFDKSYAEWRNSLNANHQNKAAPTPEEIKSTVMDSKNILAGFVPDEGLVNRNGTVQTAGNDSD